MQELNLSCDDQPLFEDACWRSVETEKTAPSSVCKFPSITNYNIFFMIHIVLN